MNQVGDVDEAMSFMKRLDQVLRLQWWKGFFIGLPCGALLVAVVRRVME